MTLRHRNSLDGAFRECGKRRPVSVNLVPDADHGGDAPEEVVKEEHARPVGPDFAEELVWQEALDG